MTPLSIALSVITYVCYVQGQSECTTPTGSIGACIALLNCPALYALLQKNDRSKEDLKMLKESHCGFNDQYMPKVCCEILPTDDIDRRCFTPDANIGRCINLYACPRLKNLLLRPVTPEKLAFVQNSKCESPDQYSVCCPTQVKPVTSKRSRCDPSVAPPDPSTECCGLDSYNGNRIVGGEATEIDQYPWLTILQYRGLRDNKIRLLCGGALISSKYVLTAGHCVSGPVLKIGTLESVRLGEYDTSTEGIDCAEAYGGNQDCADEPVIIAVENVIIHRDYNGSVLKRHDIALLRLQSLAPYTDFIRPICLPFYDVTQSTTLSDFEVAGWGAVSDTESFSNIKRHVALPYVPLKECQQSYEVQGRKVKLWKGQLCAGGVKGKDSCKGDSGGPLMTYNRRRIYQVDGIVSFGPTPCGTENVPGVYTKVYEYLPWIRSQLKP